MLLSTARHERFRGRAARLPALLLAAAMSFSPSVSAASISLYETRLDEIFSQASFGTKPVDIRFRDPVELVAPNLLDVSSKADYETLRFTFVDKFPRTTIRMFFVDRISHCAKPKSRGIAGCTNSTIVVLDADRVRGNPDRSGVDELMAHELAHIFLGNGHAGGNNLMNPSAVNGRDELTTDQASTVISDRVGRGSEAPLWVQSDERGLYVEIVPVLVVATPGELEVGRIRRH